MHPGTDLGIRLFLKRDDLIHPEIQGNKWRKLAPAIRHVQENKFKGIITFGGAFSNHLEAVAAAGRLFDIPTFGIVRGKHVDLNNPTLLQCRHDGMMLFPTDKTEYDATKGRGVEIFHSEYPQYFVLPEGGAISKAIVACAAIPSEITHQLAGLDSNLQDNSVFLCVPAGTGTTATGLIAGLKDLNGKVLVFPVVNEGLDHLSIFKLLSLIENMGGIPLSSIEKKFTFIRDYEFGGFAKYDESLMAFVRDFRGQHGILLDPIYTSKMMFGVYEMLRNGYFPAGSIVVALHTGGLQGWNGYLKRYGLALD